MKSAGDISISRPAATRQEAAVYSLIKQQLELTHTFRVSTTPVGDGINRLAAAGLLIAEPLPADAIEKWAEHIEAGPALVASLPEPS